VNALLLVAYETRFARCGGITAVMNHLPGHLRRATGVPTAVMTPFHHRIPETRVLPARPVGEMSVPFSGDSVTVRIRRHDDDWSWYFLDASDYRLPEAARLAAQDERFFSGSGHPYDLGSNPAEQGAILRRDALFFGAAVARALRELEADGDWTLAMQDWQAASTALALAGRNRKPGLRLFLTLHNSYDSGPVMPDDLWAVGVHPEDVPAAPNRATVLGRAIPLLSKPIFTVSEQFALDLTEDVLQSHIMADHLQEEFRPPNVIGIDNGPFTAMAVPEDPCLTEARRGIYEPLRAWKASRKAAFLAAVERFIPDTERRPLWGRATRFVELARDIPDLPWFVLAGRDDPRQKGYDVAAEAIRAFLQKAGNDLRAQFLFFPIPGDEGRGGLVFLRGLAESCAANILVMPFIFQEGYLSAMQASAFGVMPSFYEPFGMANEFYLNGTVGIGRATGGLLQQIVPLRSAPSFTPSVARRADRWHPASAAATGLLYREPDDLSDLAGDWRNFNAAGYLHRPDRDRTAERRIYRLFAEMAVALEHALDDALAIYHRPSNANGGPVYWSMLSAGIEHIQRRFSWDRAAAEYSQRFKPTRPDSGNPF
jgi:glycogen synthase